jgi:tRNA(Arg) A34 adenosine deaminase TadA
MTDADGRFLRRAFELAARASSKGNGPFGAVLVDESGLLLAEAENTVHELEDCTAHAEMNLLRATYGRLGEGRLARATIYASAEPCPMCAGAIFWSGVGRLVYGLSTRRLSTLDPAAPQVALDCRGVLLQGNRPIVIEGPLLEDEAARVFV